MSPLSKHGVYSLYTQIKGHKGLVLCMSITDDGKLASGGFDGCRVWDLSIIFCGAGSRRDGIIQLIRPSGAGERGATTALSWIRREDEPEDGLIFGTARGLVVCWKEVTNGQSGTISYEETYCAQLANPSEITAICFDTTSNRLAVSNRNSVIQLFRVGSKLDLHPIFSVVVKDHIPKAVTFGHRGDDRAIHTFGLHDGQIHTLSGKDGKIIQTRQTGCKIGNITSNIRRGVFCIDDPTEGVALYRYDSWERIRVYSVPAKKTVMRPRQVSFIEDCKYILSSSDHGTVYIFDRRSGATVDCLNNGQSDRIQALTATECLEQPLIFSAMCRGTDDACVIDVWSKSTETTVPRADVRIETPVQQTAWERFTSLFQGFSFICILFMALAFLWQNKHLVGHSAL